MTKPRQRDAIEFVHCLTPGCGATPLGISPGLARAHIEYFLRDDPTFQLKGGCTNCHRESRYSLEVILGMIPLQQRPRPLKADELQMLFLLEVDTAEAMAERAFVGERVLVQQRATTRTGGLAELRTRPALAPYLSAGDVLRFDFWSRFPVAKSLVSNGNEFPLKLEMGASSNALGAYFAAKAEADPELRPGNIPCSNPSCSMVFSLTYSEFRQAMRQASMNAPAGAASAITALECLVCSTSRIVDERTFDGLMKV